MDSPSILSSGNSSPFDTTNDSSSSFFNISATTWIVIIFVLALLGVNIFFYLAKGTQDITNLLKPITNLFAGVTGQIVDVSAEGAKGVVNTTAGVVDKGLTTVQNVTMPGGVPVKNTIPQPDIMQNTSLNRALNNSSSSSSSFNKDYEADEANSNIQKSGWCYIGEDRGFRSCAKVGTQDKCMSGDIFPSHEICVNPSLRA